jgi:hypothetical protein
MSIMIGYEPLTINLIMDTEDIIAANYEETSQFHHPMDIDWDMYKRLEDKFLAFTMRDDGFIVGILFFAVDSYPHIKSWKMAQQLTFYVSPAYRRYSLQMIKLSENYCKANGIDIIIQSARYGTGFCNVLDKKGYERADITYTKRLN